MRLMWLAIVLLGCTKGVRGAYEEARQDALRLPGPLATNWQPDASFSLRKASLTRELNKNLTSLPPVTKEMDMGPLNIRPRLTYDSVEIMDGRGGCPTCVRVRVSMSGRTRLQTIGLDQRVDTEANAVVSLKLGVSQSDDGVWRFTVKARDVEAVRIDAAGLSASLEGWLEPSRLWLSAAVREALEPVTIFEVHQDSVPFRAARPSVTASAVRFDLRTDTPSEAAIVPISTDLQSAWMFEIAEDSLLAALRRHAFEMDPLEVQSGPFHARVVSEPTSLSLDGDAFTLGLRLWRIDGKGWWRDYRVEGELEVAKGGDGGTLTATTQTVEQVAKSPGAVWIDPLVAIANSKVVDGIAAAVASPQDRVFERTSSEGSTRARVVSVAGADGVVAASGSLRVTADARSK